MKCTVHRVPKQCGEDLEGQIRFKYPDRVFSKAAKGKDGDTRCRLYHGSYKYIPIGIL